MGIVYTNVRHKQEKEKMTNRDIKIMLHFITKTEMFASKDEAENIISFVHGYEIGRNGKCDFSNQISEILEKEFHLKKRATGWKGQIIEFGKKKKINWETAFKQIGLKVLSKYFLKKSKNKYQKIIKLIIQSKINQIEIVKFENQKREINRFGRRWINKWIGIVAIKEKWFQEIWTDKELEIISKLNKEIVMIENKKQENIVANKKLLHLMNEFKKEACS
ncbi:MAG: hypothetical protein P1U56_26345 [Saprospiraceae bacterium]|nr:hypothetical protein [Saprospiraceae bacterium]